MAALRIASLLPSTTEIVCALGQREALVARSHECDYPPGVESLPVCTSARVAGRSSLEIDERVRELVTHGLSLYDVDADTLRELAPTLILTQDQCDVCAASLADVDAAVQAWIESAPAIVSLRPSTLGDVWEDIRRVAETLGVPDRATALVEALATRVSEIGEQTGALADPPRVAFLEWLDPLFGAGHWIPELVRLAGGRNLFGTTGGRSQTIEWEALRDADPDRIVVAACGFDLARTRGELEALSRRPGFAELRAVRKGCIFAVDGNAYFNRPGPRLVESLEILAEILLPERFSFGHEGSAWERIE